MSLFDEPGDKLNESPYCSCNLVYESPASIIRERGSRLFSFFDRTLSPAARQLKLLENENEDDVSIELKEVEVPVENEADGDKDDASELQDP